jgi:N4-(beta-N-acetylglucosaminyl)-L-asparaginase
MRHGMTPKEACLEVLKRISRNFNDDKSRLAQFDINFYALRKDGLYAGASLWNGRSVQNGQRREAQFAVNDGGESRHEPCVYLYERNS